jgi:hypothetical protein
MFLLGLGVACRVAVWLLGACDPGVVAYEAVVLSQEDCDASVYLADCQGDQHCVEEGESSDVVLVVVESWSC